MHIMLQGILDTIISWLAYSNLFEDDIERERLKNGCLICSCVKRRKFIEKDSILNNPPYGE